MGSVVTFSAADVHELRALRARAQRAAALPDLHPWGWSVDLVDPGEVVAAFAVFQLPAGLRWTCAHHRGEEGTAGFAWVVPADHPPLDPGGWAPGRPQPGSAVLPAPLAALRGERTEWTLLCASLLARELEELGGTGGYRKWGKHDLLVSDPWDTLTPAQAAANRRHTSEGRYWMESRPRDLLPRVESDGRRTTARFHTLHRRYHLPVYVHDDVYGEGFTVETGRRLIGRIPYKQPDWAGDPEHPDL